MSNGVGAVVVGWNTADEVVRCVEALFASEGVRGELRVVVVDNASNDGTADRLHERFEGEIASELIGVVENDSNRGFSAAVNQGIAWLNDKMGDENDIVLVNPDAYVEPGAIAALQDVANVNVDGKRVGVVGGRLEFADGELQPSVRRFPDVLSHVTILMKLHNFFPDLPWMKAYHADDFDYSQEMAIVDQVMGALFYIPRHALREVGVLDERFWIWFEEVDYCRRVVDAGMVTLYTARAQAVHEKGKSFGQVVSLRKQKNMTASMIRYFRKHHGFLAAGLLAAVSPVGFLLSGLQTLFGIRKRNRAL